MDLRNNFSKLEIKTLDKMANLYIEHMDSHFMSINSKVYVYEVLKKLGLHYSMFDCGFTAAEYKSLRDNQIGKIGSLTRQIDIWEPLIPYNKTVQKHDQIRKHFMKNLTAFIGDNLNQALIVATHSDICDNKAFHPGHDVTKDDLSKIGKILMSTQLLRIMPRKNEPDWDTLMKNHLDDINNTLNNDHQACQDANYQGYLVFEY